VTFLFTTVSGSVMGPTKPPIIWILMVHSSAIKGPCREADHLPPFNTEFKTAS
jgi:hypothetical protein